MSTAIILAGGLGTRLRSTVPDVPKPMAPIQGRPFLEYQMDYWLAQGVKRFVLSIGYQYDVIMNHFGDSYKNAPLHYSIEKTPLGTGGGLLLAIQTLNNNDPFLVLNGDTFFEVSLPTFLDFHKSQGSDWTFALTRSNEKGRYMGIEVTENGKILSLKSGTEQKGRFINSGVYCINPKVLQQLEFNNGQKLSLEDDILPRLMEKSAKIYGIEFMKNFIDIGVPDDYVRAATILQN